MTDGKLYIFDADGTLRRTTLLGQFYPRALHEQEPIPWMVERLKVIDWSKNLFGVATNQAGVAKGEFNQLHAEWLVQMAIRDVTEHNHWANNAQIRVCPHRTAIGCACKKPSPWMLLDIARTCHVPLSRIVYIGDMSIDEQAARAAGVAFQWAWDFCGRTRDEWLSYIENRG